MLFTSQAMLGNDMLLIESQRLEFDSRPLDSKLSESQINHPTDPSLTKHRTTVRSEAAVRQVCVWSGKLRVNVLL